MVGKYGEHVRRTMPIKGTTPRLVEIVTPDIAQRIASAKARLRLSEDEELISFYSKAVTDEGSGEEERLNCGFTDRSSAPY